MKINLKEKLKVDLNIVKYFIKLTTTISKVYIPLLAISSVCKAINPIINIILSKFIIDELLGYKRLDVLITFVLIAILGNTILNLINAFLSTKLDIIKIQIVNGFDLLIGKKIMDMDFEDIEDPEILNLKERATYPINNQDIIKEMINVITDFCGSIITLLGVALIIVTLDSYILLFILAIVILNSFIYKKTQQTQFNVFQDLAPANRAFFYYLTMTNDFSIAKDIRLYNMSPLILSEIKKYNKTVTDKFGGLYISIGKYNGLNNLNLQLQMLAVYSYMAYKVFTNFINIGSFTMYVSAANTFSANVTKGITEIIKLRQLCRYLDPYMQFERINSTKLSGTKKISDIKILNVEFKNVSFKYPRSNDYVLKNINIKILNGEKLSIIGLNGAGKTTFIKLLTRLYEPTEGEILLNGINIKNYDYKEYMSAFGVVFQDFKLFSFSIKENIVLNNIEDNDIKKIHESLIKSGLEKDILKLEKGIDTPIYKKFDKDGIELSGGQAQKLAISRTMYKNASIVILDEPTAALDPIAEFEIYTKFNELIGSKTAVYISHRLSSCKFCDKIAVFHNGEIIQYGTHDELISLNDSQYNKMYEAQSLYYA